MSFSSLSIAASALITWWARSSFWVASACMASGDLAGGALGHRRQPALQGLQLLLELAVGVLNHGARKLAPEIGGTSRATELLQKLHNRH